jgi:hypothetical protein
MIAPHRRVYWIGSILAVIFGHVALASGFHEELGDTGL